MATILRSTRRLLALATLEAGLLAAPIAFAQEEDAADHGSRAVAKASSVPASGRRKSHSPLSATFHGGVFGGGFVEGAQVGVMLNAGGSAALASPRHRQRMSFEYQYDPFTTKTFNFPEEDQTPAVSRLAQGLHELDVAIGWQGRWSRWLKTEASLSGDAWLPNNTDDRRWSLRAEGQVRIGKARGLYAEPSATLFLKKYPGYFVADRRIDQQGGEAKLEGGYEFGPFTNFALAYRVELTDYLDARYDQLEPDGTLVPAAQSKDCVSQIWYANLSVAPVRPLRLSLRYEHELNDSRHYDRRVPALDDAGSPLVKFVPDYYDYTRDRGTLKLRFLPTDSISVSALVEGWLRDFSSYEARNIDNVWTGQLRHDESLELGAEVAVGVLDIDGWGLRHELSVTVFASHLRRRSNMEREVSLATNFDVTRTFLGLELRPR